MVQASPVKVPQFGLVLVPTVEYEHPTNSIMFTGGTTLKKWVVYVGKKPTIQVPGGRTLKSYEKPIFITNRAVSDAIEKWSKQWLNHADVEYRDARPPKLKFLSKSHKRDEQGFTSPETPQRLFGVSNRSPFPNQKRVRIADPRPVNSWELGTIQLWKRSGNNPDPILHLEYLREVWDPPALGDKGKGSILTYGFSKIDEITSEERPQSESDFLSEKGTYFNRRMNRRWGQATQDLYAAIRKKGVFAQMEAVLMRQIAKQFPNRRIRISLRDQETAAKYDQRGLNVRKIIKPKRAAKRLAEYLKIQKAAERGGTLMAVPRTLRPHTPKPK